MTSNHLKTNIWNRIYHELNGLCWVLPFCRDVGLTLIQSENARGEAEDMDIHRLVN